MAARISALEELASTTDEIADFNDAHVANECGRLRRARIWLACRTGPKCEDPDTIC